MYQAAENRYETMEYKRCGRSGLKLPRVALGLWQNFGLEKTITDQEEILCHAFDHGITHFDLANNYGHPANGLAEKNFGQALKNSLLFVVFGVAGLLVICSMAAYRLARHRTRVNKFVYLLLVSSILVPFQTVMIPLIKIIASIGLYNTRIGVLLAYYGYGIPFAVFLFYGFLSSIPREIEEAALIDGGSLFQVYRCIILPLLKPICVTVAVLDVLWIYNDFLLPFVLISDNELRTLPLVMYTFFTAYERPWDLAMASLTMVLTPAIIMFVILQKQITGGIVSGAVKG